MIYDYNLFTPENVFTLTLRGNPQFIESSMVAKYTCSIYDMKKRYDSLHPSMTLRDQDHLYPLAVRYISPMRDFYVIERPPFLLDEVDFSTAKSYRQRKTPKLLNNRSIWIPWTIAIIAIRNGVYSFYLFFNDGPLQSIDDKIVSAYLPNIGHGGQVCMGQDSSTAMDKFQETLSVTEMYKSLFNMYFSGWNTDIWNSSYNIKYFDDNGILKRIQSLKSSPKDFYEILVYGRSSVAKYFKSFLFLLSHLTLQEHLDYVTHIKNNSHNVFKLSKVISQQLPGGLILEEVIVRKIDRSFSKQQIGYTNSLFSEHFESSQVSKSITLYVNNIPFFDGQPPLRYDNDKVYSMVSDPKAIAEIYQQMMAQYKNSDSSFVQNIHMNYSDLHSVVVQEGAL